MLRKIFGTMGGRGCKGRKEKHHIMRNFAKCYYSDKTKRDEIDGECDYEISEHNFVANLIITDYLQEFSTRFRVLLKWMLFKYCALCRMDSSGSG
jgi:hypothetical protein